MLPNDRSVGTVKRLPRSSSQTTDSSTRARVLATATKLFAERGYGLTSMRDIARATRVRPASLYHHFPSKAALYHEVLAGEQARLRDLMNSVLADETDFATQIERMVTLAFDYHRRHPSLAKLGLRMLLGDGLSRPYDARWLGMMDALLRPRAAKGEIKPIDPALLLITAGAIIQHHTVSDDILRDLVGRNLSKAEIEKNARVHITEVLLRSVGLDRPRR